MDRIWLGCVSWIYSGTNSNSMQFWRAPLAIQAIDHFPCRETDGQLGHPDFKKVCRKLSEFAHGHQQHSLNMWLGASVITQTD